MGNPITTGDFPQFLEDGVTMLKTGLDNLQKKALWPKLVQKGTASKLVTRMTNYENAGAASAMVEGGTHPAISFKEGYSQAFTAHQWGAKGVFTKAMKKYQQYDLVTRIMEHLRISTAAAKEILVASYLEYGATAIASVPRVAGRPIVNSIAGDQLTIFNAAHTWKSGGSTWSNNNTDSLDMTETAVQTIYQGLRRWLDNTGKPLNANIEDIVFPVNLRSKYDKLTLSPLEPATGNNAINAAKQVMKRAGIEHQWLTSTTTWYVLTDYKDGRIQWLVGWDDDVRGPVKIDEDTENMGVFVDFSLAHGVLDPHGYYRCG